MLENINEKLHIGKLILRYRKIFNERDDLQI
jgi:hypothetical protein